MEGRDRSSARLPLPAGGGAGGEAPGVTAAGETWDGGAGGGARRAGGDGEGRRGKGKVELLPEWREERGRRGAGETRRRRRDTGDGGAGRSWEGARVRERRAGAGRWRRGGVERGWGSLARVREEDERDRAIPSPGGGAGWVRVVCVCFPGWARLQVVVAPMC